MRFDVYGTWRHGLASNAGCPPILAYSGSRGICGAGSPGGEFVRHNGAWRRGFRIIEIPIIFADRLVGTSKMSRRIVWEAAFLVWKLRLAALVGRIP